MAHHFYTVFTSIEVQVWILKVRKTNNTPLANYKMSYVVQLDGKTVQTIEAQTDREGETNLVFRLPNDLKTSDGLINIFNLDLKADISGKYKGVASSAYLYYGSEHKNWQSGVEVLVKDK